MDNIDHRFNLTQMSVFFLSLIAIRSLYVLGLYYSFDIYADGDYYGILAHNLYSGHGYVITPGGEHNLFRYPGYPYFLAVLYSIFGESYTLVVITQLLLDFATLPIVYLISRQVFGDKTAVLSTFIFAVYPFSALYILRYLTETLFTFLLACAVLFTLQSIQKSRIRYFIISGIFFGSAILCRSSLFYFIFVIPVLSFFIGDPNQRHHRMMGSIVTILTAMALMVPWGMKNLDMTGTFSMIGTAGGYSVWIGNNQKFDGRDRDELPHQEEIKLQKIEQQIAKGSNLFSQENQKRYLDEALQGMIEQPVGAAWLILKKAFRFWFSIYQPSNVKYQFILIAVQAVLLGLAIIGALRIWRDLSYQWVLLSLILYLNAIHALVISTFRYSLPVMPYVIMFAAFGLISVPRMNKLIVKNFFSRKPPEHSS